MRGYEGACARLGPSVGVGLEFGESQDGSLDAVPPCFRDAAGTVPGDCRADRNRGEAPARTSAIGMSQSSPKRTLATRAFVDESNRDPDRASRAQRDLRFARRRSAKGFLGGPRLRGRADTPGSRSPSVSGEPSGEHGTVEPTMTRFDIDLKEIDAELRVLGDSRLRDERPVLGSFVRRLRAAGKPEDYRCLQTDLIDVIKGLQDGQDGIKAEQTQVSARIAKLAGDHDANRRELVEAQQRLDELKGRERLAQALRHAFLAVGDGIAWRVLDFDRAAVTVLARGTRVARFASGVGFDTELRWIEQIWSEEGRFALHNDLTTCLRHGDLTVPQPGDGRIGIYEIKTRPGARRARQDDRIASALEFLNTGHYVGPDGRTARIHRLRQRYRTHLEQLRVLMRQAHRSGFAAARPSACLLTCAVDPYAVRGYDPSDRIPDLLRRELDRHGWSTDGPRLFTYMAGMRRIRDRKGNSGQVAPFTIFPLEAADIADLLLGQIDFITVLNADLLEGALASVGIRAEITDPPDHVERFMIAAARTGNYELTVGLSSTLREQMLLELMTPASLGAAIRGLCESASSAPGPLDDGAIVAFADESRVWSGRHDPAR